MFLLADGPRFASRLAGRAVSVWPAAAGDAARLPSPVREALLPGSDPGAVAEIPVPGWPVAVAVEIAPRSQFDALAELPGGPAVLPDRFLAVAGSGRGFHGQRGRPWVALPGNLHLVAFARVELPAAAAAGPLAALPAVALVAAIDSLPGFAGRAAVKWVNDVLLEGRKVAGALARTWTRGGRVTGLLLGIGLDVEATPEVPDDPLAPGVVSLAEAAPPGAPAPVLADAFAAVAASLAAHLDLLAAGRGRELVSRYRERAGFLGREVVVEPDPLLPGEPARPVVRGRVVGLGEGLELRIEGHDAPVTAGRLRLAR